jgi:hypothetical protein
MSQTADEILKQHFEVIGQDQVAKMKSATMTGKILQGGQEFSFTMYQQRPMNFRMDITVQGQKITQAFDGENGWMVNPMMGTTDPQDMTPDMVKEMKKQADMDGQLWNYQSKGSTLEYLGQEEMEGSSVHKLKLTDKDGDITNFFLDAETFILLKTTSVNTVQGVEVESEQSYGNYQLIDGMAIPFSISTGTNGQVMGEIAIDEVKFNTEFEKDFFSKPTK